MNFGGVEFSINAEWWRDEVAQCWRARVTTGRAFLGRPTIDAGRDNLGGPFESMDAARDWALTEAFIVTGEASDAIGFMRLPEVTP
jgi:hypothetical protein